MKLFFRFICVAAISSIVTSFAEAIPQNEVVNIQLRWHHQFQFAGYYAALEKGFYKEEGLDVQLHAGAPDRQPVAEVLSGRAQYAEGNSEVLFQRLQGKPLVAMAAIFQHSASVLLTRKSSHIHSPHDLIGKKVMLMNSSEDADFLAMFKGEGISLSQVEIVPSSYDLQDLISGKVDAFNSYSTNEPYFLKLHGIPFEVIDPIAYQIDFYSDVLFTSENEVREHPERVAAVRRATLKGWRYAMDNPQEIIDLLINKYKVEKSRGHLEYEAAEIRNLMFPDLIEIGHMNPARWRFMADAFVKVGLVKADYSLDGFIYNDTPQKLPKWVLPALGISLASLIVVLLIGLYFNRLSRRLALANSSLVQSEGRLQLAMANAKQGWFDLNVATGEILVSPEYPKLLGYSPEEFHSSLSEWKNSLHPDDRDSVLAVLAKCMSNCDSASVKYRRKKKDGSWLWLQTVGQVVERREHQQALRIVGIHTDISESMMLEEQIMHLAHNDSLTGLPNRRMLNDRLLQLLALSKRTGRYGAVLFIDLDNFKPLNDTYGHSTGDLLLIEVAQRLKSRLREMDTVARFGGDEFVVLLSELEADKAEATSHALEVARDILEMLCKPYEFLLPDGIGEKTIFHNCTASIGISMCFNHESDEDDLLKWADKAMYQAKESGRNKICVYEEPQK